jgi:hypothetical protein
MLLSLSIMQEIPSKLSEQYNKYIAFKCAKPLQNCLAHTAHVHGLKSGFQVSGSTKYQQA